MHVEVGYRRVDVHVLDRSTDSWVDVIDGVDANSRFVEAADGRSLVGITDLEAPQGRIVRVPLDAAVLGRGPGAWETIVAEGDDVITQLAVTRGALLVATSADASDTVHRLDADGQALQPPVVDDLGDLIAIADGGLVGDADVDEAFVVVDTFVAPTALWKLSADGSATPATAAADASRLTGGLDSPAHPLPVARRHGDRDVPRPP